MFCKQPTESCNFKKTNEIATTCNDLSPMLKSKCFHVKLFICDPAPSYSNLPPTTESWLPKTASRAEIVSAICSFTNTTSWGQYGVILQCLNDELEKRLPYQQLHINIPTNTFPQIWKTSLLMSNPLTRTGGQSFKPVINLLPVASNLREQIILRQHPDNL